MRYSTDDANNAPKRVRYHGYVAFDSTTITPGTLYDQQCVYRHASSNCRPVRFTVGQVPRDALGEVSVAAAIAKFYGADKDAAGHAAIKAICRARGAGTTCGGLTGRTGLVQTGTERGMLVTFAPITKEANWIEPVTLFSV
jgi:hypothetical protein